MPEVEIIGPSTQGVDMRINPLALGVERLHSAMNIAFEEGTIRTRPGFVYDSLGLKGQIQGIEVFSPARGISYTSFAEDSSFLVSVVSGSPFSSEIRSDCVFCKPVSICPETVDFTCAGGVFIYQAENYLIFQSPRTNTWWWDGDGCMDESPGLSGDDCEYLKFVPPVTLPERKPPPCPIDVRVTVLDFDTHQPLDNVDLRMLSPFGRKYDNITGEDGVSEFSFHADTYSFELSRQDYHTSSGAMTFQYPGNYFLYMNRVQGLVPMILKTIAKATGLPIPFTPIDVTTPYGVRKFVSDENAEVRFNTLPGFHSYRGVPPYYLVREGSFTVNGPSTVIVPFEVNPSLPPPVIPNNPFDPNIPIPPDPNPQPRRVLVIEYRPSTGSPTPTTNVKMDLNGSQLYEYSINADDSQAYLFFGTLRSISSYRSPTSWEMTDYPPGDRFEPPDYLSGYIGFNEYIVKIGQNTVTLENSFGGSGDSSYGAELIAHIYDYQGGILEHKTSKPMVTKSWSADSPEINFEFELNYDDVFGS